MDKKIDEMTRNKRRMIRQIQAAAARSLLMPALETAGLEADIETQAFRAKVTVRLDACRGLQFFVTYKYLREHNTADEVILAVLDLKDAAQRIGGKLKFV